MPTTDPSYEQSRGRVEIIQRCSDLMPFLRRKEENHASFP